MISVIIPTYQAEKVLERAIRSVFRQNGDFQIEIIVVDDGSTDQTVQIAKNLGCVVHEFSTNSGGPNRGRNKGIELAKGEYIAFLDQDDEWLPDKLIRQFEQIGKGYDFVYSSSIAGPGPAN